MRRQFVFSLDVLSTGYTNLKMCSLPQYYQGFKDLVVWRISTIGVQSQGEVFRRAQEANEGVFLKNV